MSRLGVLVIATALVAGCSADTSLPTAPVNVPVFSQSGTGSPSSLSSNSSSTSSPASHSSSANANANGGNFGTPLTGSEEVPANASPARGNAIFQLNNAGTEITYQLIVANIENVVQAHIHQGPAGVIGPIVVWLYPSTSPPAAPSGGGRIDGVIATGTFTAANFIGPLAGQPLSALIDDLQNGNAYVNVHTNDGIAPTNTGPGDIPGGEIRGRVEHRGH